MTTELRVELARRMSAELGQQVDPEEIDITAAVVSRTGGVLYEGHLGTIKTRVGVGPEGSVSYRIQFGPNGPSTEV